LEVFFFKKIKTWHIHLFIFLNWARTSLDLNFYETLHQWKTCEQLTCQVLIFFFQNFKVHFWMNNGYVDLQQISQKPCRHLSFSVVLSSVPGWLRVKLAKDVRSCYDVDHMPRWPVLRTLQWLTNQTCLTLRPAPIAYADELTDF
jgi:hypothetical protein